MSDEQRINELEIKLVYQEQALNQLSDEFYRQQQQLHKLENQVSALLEKIKTLSAADSGEMISDERPPHY